MVTKRGTLYSGSCKEMFKRISPRPTTTKGKIEGCRTRPFLRSHGNGGEQFLGESCYYHKDVNECHKISWYDRKKKDLAVKDRTDLCFNIIFLLCDIKTGEDFKAADSTQYASHERVILRYKSKLGIELNNYKLLYKESTEKAVFSFDIVKLGDPYYKNFTTVDTFVAKLQDYFDDELDDSSLPNRYFIDKIKNFNTTFSKLIEDSHNIKINRINLFNDLGYYLVRTIKNNKISQSEFTFETYIEPYKTELEEYCDRIILRGRLAGKTEEGVIDNIITKCKEKYLYSQNNGTEQMSSVVPEDISIETIKTFINDSREMNNFIGSMLFTPADKLKFKQYFVDTVSEINKEIFMKVVIINLLLLILPKILEQLSIHSKISKQQKIKLEEERNILPYLEPLKQEMSDNFNELQTRFSEVISSNQAAIAENTSMLTANKEHIQLNQEHLNRLEN